MHSVYGGVGAHDFINPMVFVKCICRGGAHDLNPWCLHSVYRGDRAHDLTPWCLHSVYGGDGAHDLTPWCLHSVYGGDGAYDLINPMLFA